MRFPGFTHTNTVDGRRPWIVYSSCSDFADRNWIDVMNMRSCFGKKRASRAKRRAGAGRGLPDPAPGRSGPSSATRPPASRAGVRDLPRHHLPQATASTARRSTPP